MKKQTIENLFLLLKSALWQDGQLVKAMADVDWKELYALAKEQCLVCVMADALRYVGEEQDIAEEKLRWLAFVIKQERKNHEMNELIGKLFQLFTTHGLSPVLLKGQAFAANYPYPLHRQCGDIDIYFKHRKDCARAVAWASKVDKVAAESSDNKRERKHFTFSLEREAVELHYYMCLFDNEQLQQRLQAIIDAEFDTNPPFYVEIEGKRIEAVPPTLSVLHQLIHISRHLLEAGIGLRQICDLALFLDRHHEEIDSKRLNGYLDELELIKVAQSLGHVMVHRMGLDERKVPFGINDSYADFILREIFEGGNFGKKKIEYRKDKCSLIRKIASIFYFYNRCQLYKPLFPSEAKSYFMHKIKLNIKLLIKHHY